MSEETLQKLLECRQIREQLGGENRHSQQSKSIPDSLDSVYFYHRECYQKYTYASALMMRKIGDSAAPQNEDGSQRAFRATSSKTDVKDSRGRFPNKCMICKKEQLKVKSKRQPLTKIITLTAEERLKKAAQLNDDQELLIQVSEADLIAKDF